MFYDITNQNFCEDCGRDLNSKYNNMRRAKLRLSNEEYTNLKDEMTIKSMDESWVTTVQPPPNAQTDESCLFMLNFNKAGDTMVTSSINIIDIWDFTTKEKRRSLTDHVEIVTGLEWMKSPEDNTFISCSLDKTMKIWRDYTCVQTLRHHEDWLRCISVSKDNQYLISGCVSSVVWAYDLQKQQPVFNITNKDGKASLNTINSLDFQQDSLVFLSGARDGYIKLYDIRTNPTKPIQEIFSHKMKLNSAVFGQNNNMILSAGRDSTARLWDLRMTRAIEESKSAATGNQPVKGYVAEYRGHVSQGYNIASHFFVGDKYVISGSENGYIYIYNTQTAKLVRKIPAGTKVIHLLKPYPSPDIGFVYSGLQKSTIHFFDAKTTEDQKPKKDKAIMDQQANDFNEPAANIIEDFMSENGELILKVFHSNNITYSSGVSFDNLIQMIMRQNDPDSRTLYRKLNEAILRNMRQFMQNAQNPQPQEPKESEIKEKHKKKPEFREINEKVKHCEKCKEIEMIRALEKDSLELNCNLIKNLP